ncbi:MAG: hypothetical protein IID43_04795, partial [Planctomycetes bacterium]|nr:hypothetical protein [Planctomycetota bacterium]
MMTKPETSFGFLLTPRRTERLRSSWNARGRPSYGRRFAHTRIVGLIVAIAGIGVPANLEMAVYAAEPETSPDPKGTPPVTPKTDKDKEAQETKEEGTKQGTPKKQGSKRKPSGKQTPPKPSGKKPKAQESTDKPAGGIDMPADVQRQLDELFERRLSKRGADSEDPIQADKPKRSHPRPRSGTRTPKRPGATSPRGQDKPGATDASTGDNAPTGPTTKLDLPPSQEAVPARHRTYSFSIKNGTYEQLLQGINRQTGQAILGDAPKDGKVTFITDEVLTYTEMLSRVRMLLFNYKPHDPYWLREHDTHLKVVRVTDLYRELGLDRMFKSVEDFRAANLPEEELALVIYTPKSGSVARLNMLRDFLPDYVRIAPLEGRNAVTIFALVRDIEKYMQLKGIFVDGVGGQDPRTLEIIRVEHIKPSEAWVKIQSLIDLGGASRPRPKLGGRRGRETSVLDAMPEPTVSVVPEDLQGVLIVRAMQDKIDEIKLLLPYVDVDTEETFDPTIIELEHMVADELIPLVEQILAAAPSGPKPTFGAKKSSRSKKGRKKKRSSSSASSLGAAASNKITLIPHPSGSAIIVLAAEQDVQRVRE